MIVTGQPKDEHLVELQNYIISTLAKDYNVLVSKDDPILVAVIINKLCLDYSAKQAIQSFEQSIEHIENVNVQSISTAKNLAENLITHSGRYIETEIKEIFKSQVESLQKEIATLDLQVKNSISPILQKGKATHEKNIKMLIYVCAFLAFLSLLNIGLFLIK
ncbi:MULTISPECIES: hypothetical protein [unclassified Acinetobacter]|uniref:hypothetical protein n=1 Tax=unclassified Acinetobacter TaxID=196816 RepID=UPI0015D2F673|nr:MULTISPECIES: hypothetical protein [unclassified Acinetobacter]UUS62526.1 hypothetical protein MST17_16590 [Acinetobacter sp. YH16056_T]